MNKDILFLENFYTLLNAGYSIEESLLICQSVIGDKTITKMISQLKEGYSIDEILIQHSFPTLFKEYFVFYLSKNCLSESIEKSLNIYRVKKDYQQKLKSQLTYPLILLIFLFLFSLFVVFILLPNVNSLFDSFQIEKTIVINMIFFILSIFPYLFICTFLFIVLSFLYLFYGLKHKKFKIIEMFLCIPVLNILLQKYFSLKFSIYYQELAQENIDSAKIIQILNDQMNQSDIKIVLYEMHTRMNEGEAIEDILYDFEYFDSLFLTFFQMYMKNPQRHQSLNDYIQMTYQQIDQWISSFLKYLIPSIYSFVAVFVITIYISVIIPMMNVISDI